MIVKGVSRKIFRRIGLGDCPPVHVERAHELFRRITQQFTLEGCPIYLLKFGSKFSKTKTFCFENCIFLTFGLGMCEGLGEDSRHGIGHVNIQVGSCICFNVFGCHDMCT